MSARHGGIAQLRQAGFAGADCVWRMWRFGVFIAHGD